MKILLLMFITSALLSGCASVKQLENAESCRVWKESPFFFPPTAVQAWNRSASWSGHCRSLWWDCKNVTGRLEDNGDISISNHEDYKLNWDKPDIIIGKLLNGEFTYNGENPLAKFISYSAMRADMQDLAVKYNVHAFGMSNEVAIRFNKECTAEQAILGSLVLGAVERLQAESSQSSESYKR